MWRSKPFHALQACNPPDTFFLLGLIAKACGKQFVYDQHDLCPELYESRFPDGARLPHRVKATFQDGALMASAVMLLFTILCHLIPGPLIGAFTKDLAVTAIGSEYLEIISWNFVASGLIFVASSMFQAMGNTVPSLIASAVRITLVAVPVLWLSRVPGFQLRWIWFVAVGAVVVHLIVSMVFLRREFRLRLGGLEAQGAERRQR